MDLKYNKRYIIGILVITIVFGFFFFISFSNMLEDKPETGKKADYIMMLENEYENIEFNKDDDFSNFCLIEDEMVVEPTKYQYYVKPCFDFVIESDGVVIKKPLAKDFYDFNFEVGMKIVKINDEVLSGKTYFEILDLLYSNKLGTKKEFVTSDNQSIEYEYRVYNNKYEYKEEENVLYIYNLDEITVKAIYEIYLLHPELVIDLSMATVSYYESIKDFVSLFYSGKDLLFSKPEGVYGSTKGRKILDMTIILGDNNDLGVNFMLTTITKLNSNIKVLKEISSNETVLLSVTSFKTIKILQSSNYTIYLKKYVVETTLSYSGDVV